MDADIEKMHLQSIEEYVLDEAKIVTYRWLSKVLNVHVNLSKELLSKFSSDPSHENKVYLTYLISGKLKDGTYSVLVVEQDKFEEVKLDFESISSHHVYSVQKNKETPSANLLYMVNSEKVENELDVSKQIGVIKCASSIQRAEDELSNLRLNSMLKNAPSVTPAPAKKTAPPSDNKDKEEDKPTSDSKKAEVKKSPEKKPKAAGGIAAMFAAQSSKSTSAAASSSNSKSKAKPPPKKGGGINSFFSKAPKPESPPKGQVNKKPETDEAMEIDISSEETDKKSDDKKEEPKVEITSPPAEKSKDQEEASTSKSSGKTPKSKPKKKSKPKSSSKPAKTRKRIKVIDSDSEDDMFASEREDSPEPIRSRSPTPPPSRKIIDSDDEVIPPTPQPENGAKNRRKRKVTKDESYMDEDGFIVTEKKTVYESYSESESETADTAKKPKEESAAKPVKTPESAAKVEKPTTSKETKKPAKKVVSPVKNKQSSLMNFFKKV